MLKNYIQIAIRNLKRRKIYAVINIIGLSTGLACAVFIYNWVQDELSYDDHFPKKDQIHRVVAEAGVGKDRWHQSVTSLPLGPTMASTFPEVQASVRLDKNDGIVENGDIRFVEDHIIFTDPTFFEIFDYHLLQGNELTALSDPYKIVLTQSMAKKYFGDENPVGQSLKMFLYDPDGRGAEYEVTGVIADPPEASHFTFKMLGSLLTIESVSEGAFQNWGNNSYHTYVLLNEGAVPAELEGKLPEMAKAHMGEMLETYDLYYRFYLQPVSSIYLHSNLMYEFKATGNMAYIWIFSAIGIFILLLAIINYINLSASFLLERARETGVRKVLGARRSQLIQQHLAETLILTFLSMLFAGLLIEVFKPLFYDLSGKSNILLNRVDLIFQLLVLCLPLGLIAGYFPARKLAGIHTISSLKGSIGKNNKKDVRNVLVAFQFAVTLTILVGLIVVSQQLEFVRSKPLGYDKENLMILRVNGNEEVKKGYSAFKDNLKTHTNIIDITRSGSMITHGLGNGNARIQRESGEEQFEKLYRLQVGYDYLKTYGIELLAGRNFSPEISTDSTEAFIINEKAAAAYGWTPEEAVNQEMVYSGRKGRIIGVTSNFHFNSLRHEIEPMGMYVQPNFSRITIKGRDVRKTFAEVEKAWKEHFPSAIFDYTFQDEALLGSYQGEQRFSKIVSVFSVISLLIAMLGLLGLVGYTVSTKIKEIGIRKVLGASVLEIIALISGSFLRLIFIAAIVAFPVAWWMMTKWLDEFTYHINMQVWFFIGAMSIVLLMAMAIIFAQTYKASRTNPAEALKEE